MRLVLVGGGTAGHIFPTIAVARQLAVLSGSEVELSAVCGSRELDRMLYRDVDLDVVPLPARGIVGVAWWRLPWRALLLIQSVFFVWRDFSRRRPDAVVASGGYVSVPVLLVSWIRRIPSVIFSGDAALGWATRVMAPLASVATVSFEEARSQIWRTPVETVGYPVRGTFAAPNAAAGRSALGIPGTAPLIVVMGGSQGSHVINEALRADLLYLLGKARVVHVSGQRDYQTLAAERDQLPKELRDRYRLHEFIRRGFANLLAAADIVVCRAGATSVAELSAVGAPAVLIPGQFGAGHQVATAEAMAKAGAAVMLSESDLQSGQLGATLLQLLDDRSQLRRLSDATRARGRPQAAKRIAQIALSLARRVATVDG